MLPRQAPSLKVFALVDHGLTTLPPHFTDVTGNVPPDQPLLEAVQNMEEGRRIYGAPIIESARKLVQTWGPLTQDLFDSKAFDRELTRVEHRYLQIIQEENPGVKLNFEWSQGVGANGVGIVGLPENTAVLGFINTSPGGA